MAARNFSSAARPHLSTSVAAERSQGHSDTPTGHLLRNTYVRTPFRPTDLGGFHRLFPDGCFGFVSNVHPEIKL